MRTQNPYPYATSFGPNNCNGDTINLHCDHTNIRHPEASSVLVFSKDLKTLEGIIRRTLFSDDIGAGSHEVKVSTVKSIVVGVSHGPASCEVFGDILGDIWLSWRININNLLVLTFMSSIGEFCMHAPYLAEHTVLRNHNHFCY